MNQFHLTKRLQKALLVPLAVIAGAYGASAQPSPIGAWDFVLRGQQKGVAQITFNADFTISGSEIITIRPQKSVESDNPRSEFDNDNPRGAESSGTGSTVTASVNFYGAAPLVGTWTFADSSGGLVGLLIESDSVTTNGISFRGKLGPNRLNLVGYHESRVIHYRGVPLNTVRDISGDYFITGKKNSVPYVEVFSLTPDVNANTYLLSGEGPAYTVMGRAMISGQNQLAIFGLQSIGSNGVLSAISGPFKPGRGRGSLNGRDELHDRVTARVRKQGL